MFEHVSDLQWKSHSKDGLFRTGDQNMVISLEMLSLASSTFFSDIVSSYIANSQMQCFFLTYIELKVHEEAYAWLRFISMFNLCSCSGERCFVIRQSSIPHMLARSTTGTTQRCSRLVDTGTYNIIYTVQCHLQGSYKL